MHTGILVIVTLRVWCSSGSPLCLSVLQAPAWAQGRVLQGGLAWPPAPVALAAGGGSGLTSLYLQKSQEAEYMGRARQELPSCTQSLGDGHCHPCWSYPSSGAAQGRAAVSLMLL